MIIFMIKNSEKIQNRSSIHVNEKVCGVLELKLLEQPKAQMPLLRSASRNKFWDFVKDEKKPKGSFAK